MEETQQQPLRSSFPPAGTAKWLFNSSAGSAGGSSSFGQDSGYNSYHSTTPNNTFNLSSRHGASATLATIDEANEGDCSMNDSGSSAAGAVCSNILTPKTAASIDQISNFHLTTPNSELRPKRSIRRRVDFNSGGAPADGSSDRSFFVAPTTPERLPLSRSISFDLSDTPLRTGSRSSQQIQLTPHKAKGGHSVKRKLSSLRGKLYSDDGDGNGDVMTSPEDGGDENRANDLNDSLDCKRLDISPIPKMKRHKPNENITNLIRSSTPKTASSQPRFLMGSTENIDTNAITSGGPNVDPVRKSFRKFQSFSPSKMKSNRLSRQEGRGWSQGSRLVGRKGDSGETRPDPLAELQLTPQKLPDSVGYVTPSKEQRVLVEIHPNVDYQPPMNLAGLITAPILDDPNPPERDVQLEQAITTVPAFEDFSMTPSKANLIDPELTVGDYSGSVFASEDFLARHASNFSFGPTLHSIVEEKSPIRQRDIRLAGKLMPAKTPPSSCKSSASSASALSSARKPKRLGTKSTSSGSLKGSPMPKGLRGVPASPKVLRRTTPTSLQNRSGIYCGRDHLNVLKRLYERDKDSLHILLDYLTDEDLVQVVQVSKGWKAIIQSLPKQWQRLQKFLKLQRGNKENHPHGQSSRPVLPQLRKADEPGSSSMTFDATVPPTKAPHVSTEGQPPVVTAQPVPEAFIGKRRPFRNCNSLDNTSSTMGNCSLYTSFGSESGNNTERRRRLSAAAVTPHSPPVSPSKFKFVTNQKVASHLKQSEQLRPCPRCNKPSRVILARSSKNGQNKARSSTVVARLEKSYTLPDSDTSNDLNGTMHKTVSASGFRSNFCEDNSSGAGWNNNDYSATGSNLNSVKKNLFNSASGSDRLTPTVVVKPSTEGRRNSKPHLVEMASAVERRRLRSGAKSVDYLTYPSVAAVTGADSMGVRDSQCDYAICSSKNCGFQFCIKCLCEYHPETVCLDLAPNSPSKDEDRGRPNVACSRQSRRSLQRLCK